MSGLGRARREEWCDRAACVLVVLDLDVVLLACGEGDRAAVFGWGVIGPVVVEQLAGHPQANAVVGDGGEAVRFGVEWLYLACPADREVVRPHSGCRLAGSPVEVHGRV